MAHNLVVSVCISLFWIVIIDLCFIAQQGEKRAVWGRPQIKDNHNGKIFSAIWGDPSFLVILLCQTKGRQSTTSYDQ